MRDLISIIVIISSIILSIYVGIWLMLVGGIVQLLNSINPIDSLGIALGITRIIFSKTILVIILKLGLWIKWAKKYLNRADRRKTKQKVRKENENE